MEDYRKIAIELGQTLINKAPETREDVERMLPELKESEDEMIRKELIDFVKSRLAGFTDCKRFTDWLEKQGEHANFRNKIQIGDKVTRNRDGVLVNLSQLNRVAKKDEKQGEQKSAWSEEDEKLVEWSIINLTELKHRFGEEYGKVGDCINWLKSIKDRVQPQPKQEWSEEDERIRHSLMIDLCNAQTDDKEVQNEINKEINWLNSLRPQNRWKPSDEQMHYLSWIANIKLGDGVVEQEVSKRLNELLEDLKKLKEE